jgi:hypothetical protein
MKYPAFLTDYFLDLDSNCQQTCSEAPGFPESISYADKFRIFDIQSKIAHYLQSHTKSGTIGALVPGANCKGYANKFLLISFVLTFLRMSPLCHDTIPRVYGRYNSMK